MPLINYVDALLSNDTVPLMCDAANRNMEFVTGLLLAASEGVNTIYFNLPIAGNEDPFSKNRERVYCYELYHQWRSHWPDGFPYTLCGETDKRGHPLIRGKYLDDTIPDFLVHVPGRMDNLLVMEVKRAAAEPAKIIHDLAKLTAFRRSLVDRDGNPANYQHAFLWLYGASRDAWPRLEGDIITELVRAAPQKAVTEDDVDLSLLRVFIHEHPGVRAVEQIWSVNQ